MVFLVLLIGILNLVLGFALAVYIEPKFLAGGATSAAHTAGDKHLSEEFLDHLEQQQTQAGQPR